MSGLIHASRRNFLQAAGTGAAALAASGLGLIQSASSQAAAGSGSSASSAPIGPIKQINAGTLNVGYHEAGPASGPVVILLSTAGPTTFTALPKSRRCSPQGAIASLFRICAVTARQHFSPPTRRATASRPCSRSISST